MRKSLYLSTCASLFIFASPSLGATKSVLKGASLAPLATVSLATAKATALQARPGAITDQEIEKEKGGSGLRYSFDITSHGKAYEVGVDAKTGKVLENAQEGAHPD